MNNDKCVTCIVSSRPLTNIVRKTSNFAYVSKDHLGVIGDVTLA